MHNLAVTQHHRKDDRSTNERDQKCFLRELLTTGSGCRAFHYPAQNLRGLGSAPRGFLHAYSLLVPELHWCSFLPSSARSFFSRIFPSSLVEHWLPCVLQQNFFLRSSAEFFLVDPASPFSSRIFPAFFSRIVLQQLLLGRSLVTLRLRRLLCTLLGRHLLRSSFDTRG